MSAIATTKRAAMLQAKAIITEQRRDARLVFLKDLLLAWQGNPKADNEYMAELRGRITQLSRKVKES